jgi:hypothetical protein
MSERAGTPELVLLGLVVVLAAAGMLLGAGGGDASRGASHGTAGISAARVALVERRVERLRGLRFLHRVPVHVITAQEARRYGVAEEARSAQPVRERGEVEVEKLLGLLAPDVDLAKVKSAIYGEQVAGFYDTRRKQLMLVRGAGVDEVTLAHELTHALEDQHFQLDRLAGRSQERLSDDATEAYTALVEGTATEVMVRYMLRYPKSAPSLGDALGSLGASASSTPLPPYVMRSLLFPYLRGQAFAAALRHGTSSWALVNVALRYRPPISSAEVIDPDRWVRVQRPAPVRLGGAGAVRGDGWQRAAGSTFGQFETTQLLYASSGAAAAERLAAGWDGGRYELWRRDGWASRSRTGACAAPCRSRDALVLAWRLARPRAASALAGGLQTWLRKGLHARTARRGGWRLQGGTAAALRVRGRDVRVALAPTARLAAALAQ